MVMEVLIGELVVIMRVVLTILAVLSAKSVDERVRLGEDRDIAARTVARTEISCCAEREERR